MYITNSAINTIESSSFQINCDDVFIICSPNCDKEKHHII